MGERNTGDRKIEFPFLLSKLDLKKKLRTENQSTNRRPHKCLIVYDSKHFKHSCDPNSLYFYIVANVESNTLFLDILNIYNTCSFLQHLPGSLDLY